MQRKKSSVNRREFPLLPLLRKGSSHWRIKERRVFTISSPEGPQKSLFTVYEMNDGTEFIVSRGHIYARIGERGWKILMGRERSRFVRNIEKHSK